MKTTVMVTVMMTLAAAASAQVMVYETSARAAKEQQLQILTEKTPASGVYVSFETQPVTGAPYSAEAVTETVQALADGNRIVRRTTARIYRDGKGRTRRETLGPDGEIKSITISDPSTGRSYMIDPGTNTVRGAGMATYVTSGSGSGGVAGGGGSFAYFLSTEAKQQAELKAKQQVDADPKARQEAEVTAELKARLATGQATAVTSVGPVNWVASTASSAGEPPTKEDLGQQVVEGVTAKGTRTTTVIPAGAIGNELQISIISEEWFSADLKVLVMTKHADPRSGETTYRLTGITRGEPNPSLFEPPAGVIVK
jgi:hypothetical protein